MEDKELLSTFYFFARIYNRSFTTIIATNSAGKIVPAHPDYLVVHDVIVKIFTKEHDMNFPNFYLILISAICLSSAGCNTRNGASDRSNGASGDTISTQGSIESVNLRDSMIVFNTDKGFDTVFYDKNTKFTIGDPGKVLRPQLQINVQYVEMNKRKVAVKVQPAATGEDTAKK